MLNVGHRQKREFDNIEERAKLEVCILLWDCLRSWEFQTWWLLCPDPSLQSKILKPTSYPVIYHPSFFSFYHSFSAYVCKLNFAVFYTLRENYIFWVLLKLLFRLTDLCEAFSHVWIVTLCTWGFSFSFNYANLGEEKYYNSCMQMLYWNYTHSRIISLSSSAALTSPWGFQFTIRQFTI